jgi:hypothetical protein
MTVYAYQNRCVLCDKLFDTPDKRQVACPGCRRWLRRRGRIRAQIMRILDALGFGLCVLVVWIVSDWLLYRLGDGALNTPAEFVTGIIFASGGYWAGQGGFRRRA